MPKASASKPNETKNRALTRMIELAASKSSRLAMGVLAAASLVMFLPEGISDPRIIGYLGAMGTEAFGSLLELVASGKDISNRKLLEEISAVLNEDRFAALLTEANFQRTLARLFERQEHLIQYVVANSEASVVHSLLDQLEQYQLLRSDLCRELRTIQGDLERKHQEVMRGLRHQIQVTENVADTIRRLTIGVDRLSVDYSYRIQNFLTEYLGSSDKPVPFGGREAQLAALNDWMTDPGAQPYLLIAAEAGRGKSALLVHWAQSVMAQGEARIAFVPISIRFNTTLGSVAFAALAARLAEIHGESIEYADFSVEQWRAVCMSYLRRGFIDQKPVIVVLDGLDEAADWKPGPDLVPLPPPDGVRVVVSSRYLAGDVDDQGWLRRLGWENPSWACSMSLPMLTRQGINDVLLKMGDPLENLVTRVDLVGELSRLTQGDPLLIRLYVESLLPYEGKAASLRPEDLPSIREGLFGYFERWWDDQRRLWLLRGRDPLSAKEGVLDFLCVCSAALGPLSRDDISIVAGGDLASGLKIKLVAQEVDRFIRGDGQIQGYTFSHPRLGQFFWEQLSRREQQSWKARFLDYGDSVLEALNTGRLDPSEAPPYVLKYYGAHLERGSCPDASLYSLISEGWLRAWEAMEGTYAGFLSDVERAWRRAEAVHCTPMQIKSALCCASIASLSIAALPELLAPAIQRKIINEFQAKLIKFVVHNRRERIDLFFSIASYLPTEVVREGIGSVRSISDTVVLVHVLASLALFFRGKSRNNAFEYLFILAKTTVDSRDRAQALIELAEHLPNELKREALRGALGAIQAMSSEREQANMLKQIIPHLAEEELAEACAFIIAMKSEEERASALTVLIPHLKKAAVLNEALMAIQFISKKAKRREALVELVPHLPAELLDDTFEMVLAIEDELEQAQTLTKVVPHFPRGLKLRAVKKALAVTLTIKKDRPRVDTLVSLAPHLRERDFEQVLQSIQTIKDQTVEDEMLRAEALTNLAPYLPGELVCEALLMAKAIRDNKVRAQALTSIGRYLPKGEREQALREALTAIEGIGWQYDREKLQALTRLAQCMPAERDKILEKALTLGATMRPEATRVQVLLGLASELPEELANQALEAALVAAQNLKKEEDRAQALNDIALMLPRDKRGDVLQMALKITQSIKGEKARLEALASLVSNLPKELLSDAVAKARIDWQYYLRELSAFQRSMILECIDKLKPLILAEGPEAVEETFHAIRTVGQWWP